jgi:hypothetical protein
MISILHKMANQPVGANGRACKAWEAPRNCQCHTHGCMQECSQRERRGPTCHGVARDGAVAAGVDAHAHPEPAEHQVLLQPVHRHGHHHLALAPLLAGGLGGEQRGGPVQLEQRLQCSAEVGGRGSAQSPRFLKQQPLSCPRGSDAEFAMRMGFAAAGRV